MNHSRYYITSHRAIHNPDIICLQETQLGPNSTLKNSKQIKFQDYKIYRKDSTPGKWGVAVLVKQNIPQWEMKINSKLEQVSVKVFYKGKEMSVTSLCLPPGIRYYFLKCLLYTNYRATHGRQTN